MVGKAESKNDNVPVEQGVAVPAVPVDASAPAEEVRPIPLEELNRFITESFLEHCQPGIDRDVRRLSQKHEIYASAAPFILHMDRRQRRPNGHARGGFRGV